MSKLYVETCGRCFGAGTIDYGNVTFVGRDGTHARHCFKCRGTGTITFKSSPEAREKARNKRLEKKQAEYAAKQAEYEARYEEERQQNGGKTKAEIQRERVEKARADFRAKAADVIAELQSFPVNFNFVHSIAEEMYEYCRVPSGRGLSITIEILAKQHGRRGSKKFWAAHDDYSDLFKDVLTPAAEAYRDSYYNSEAA